MTIQTIPNLECLNTFQMSRAQRQRQNINIVSAVAISPDKKRIVAAGDCLANDDYKGRSGFHLWNLEIEEEQNISQAARAWPHASNVLSLAFSADGSAIALGSSDQKYGSKPARGQASLSLWQVSDLPDYRVMETSKNAIFSVVSHPAEHSFAAIDLQGNITLWHDYNHTDELHEIKHWQAHNGSSYSRRTNLVLAFSHDGKTLYSGGTDKQIKAWCAITGDLVFELPKQDHCLRSLAVSPDGETLVSGSDQRIRIWNAKTGELQHSFFGHPDWVRGLAITADSQFLLSTGDAKIKVWDLKTAKKLCTIPAHPAAIRGMAMSTDFSRIVTGSKDGTVKVWQVQA